MRIMFIYLNKGYDDFMAYEMRDVNFRKLNFSRKGYSIFAMIAMNLIVTHPHPSPDFSEVCDLRREGLPYFYLNDHSNR